jgi:hypothetical protein
MILTDPMLWRLVWKEYRVQRSFWLAIAVSAVGLMWLLMWLLDPRGRAEAPWLVALVLPVLFSLGSSAVSFASETEEGTTDLLRIMAARTSRVFCSKIAFSLAGTATMWICLLAVARLMTWDHALPRFNDRSLAGHGLMWMVYAVQLLAWGFFFSLICRKVLTAVCLTGVFSPLSAVLIIAMFKKPGSDPPDAAFLLFVPPLGALSYLLTIKMMSGLTLDQWLPTRFAPGASVTLSETVPADRRMARLAAVRETAPLWRRLFTRLCWLEFREALSLGHVLWFAGLLLMVFFPLGSVAVPDPARTIFGVAFSSLLAGIWTFRAEGGKRTRFLADHGLSPHAVWLSKQLVWGLLAAAVAAPFLVGVTIANHREIGQVQAAYSSIYHPDVPGASAMTFVAIIACLGYATGQFASMLVPRTIISGFLACVCGTLLSFWIWLMIALQVPLLLSAAPVFTILLVTTLAWSRHWLLEQTTWTTCWRPCLALVASLGMVWGAIGVFRVFEVPHPDFVDNIAPLREAQGRPITAQEAATANLYRQAVAQIQWDGSGPDGLSQVRFKATPAGWDQATDDKLRWLAENRDALRIALSATERPACAFNDPQRPLSDWNSNLVSQSEFTWLATLILLSARELEAAGKFDEALDRYVATLWLARHVASRGTTREWADGIQIERMVSEWVPLWAAHPDQTAERIEAGLRRINQEVPQFPMLQDALLTEHYLISRALRGDWSEPMSTQNPQAAEEIRMSARAVDVCGPWERVRALRVLDLFAASQLHCASFLAVALAAPGKDMAQIAEDVVAVPIIGNEFQNALNFRARVVLEDHSSANAFFGPASPARNSQERIPWNWIRTTPLLRTRIPPDHSHIWYLGLRRELSLRIMRLRMRLAAFKKTHGEYPDQLSFTTFGLDAIDPYSGAEFGYRPRGFQTSAHIVNGLTFTPSLVEAGTPIIWSAGPGNIRFFNGVAATNDLPTRFPQQMLMLYPPAFTLP